ncbi:hypothetical protein [Tomitella cavernea]|uniref:Uncharacterized protein n=1 Tax=Tomitella cavernea TaxID=1387982 RepID=A0ABP9CSN9_9ACTN|nr:hypothetical protein [Tomitella cavernea]
MTEEPRSDDARDRERDNEDRSPLDSGDTPTNPEKDTRHRDERLRDLVDRMEEDVEAERRHDDVRGNVGEREETTLVEPDDQAPD